MHSLRAILFAGLLLPLPSIAGVWAHYSFDTDFTDTSGNGRHGSLTDVGAPGNSGIVSSAGDFKFGGGAMNFSADRDYIAIPSKTFSSGVPYTIAFWARKTAGDTGDRALWDMVIGERDNANFFIALGDTNGDAGLRWRSSSNAANRQADFPIPKDHDWRHYAIVASGTTIAIYLDGALFGTATDKLTGFILDTIGEAYTADRNFSFHGQIDEMWIFDEALAADAVAALYQTNDPGVASGYAGFHHLYDGDFSDSSAGENHGTPAGGAAITTDPGDIVAGAGALALDGTDNCHVTLATPISYGAADPWTAAWWARRTGTNKGMIMGLAGNTSDFIWLNDNFNGLRFRSSNAVTLDFTAPKDTQLHHYALVADGVGNLSLYLDGQPAQTLTGNTSFTIDSIGKAYPTTSLHYNFQGTLDEIRVVPTALNAAQVKQIYDDEKPDSVPSSVTRIRIFLLAGQSNADGRAVVEDLPAALRTPRNDVDFYYKTEGNLPALTTLRPGLSETTQFGPEILLGHRLADLHQDEEDTRVAIIKYANGGTNLHTQWKAGGDGTTSGDGPEYVVFQQTVASGLAALAAAHPLATLDLQTMVWMQGESDAVAGSSALYQANLAAFIADVRATYGESLPFVIGRLSSRQTALAAAHLDLVRAAQNAVAAADRLTAVIDTDDFGMKTDNLHFDAAGQQSMGSAFAAEAAYYAWMVDTFTPEDIAAGLAEPDADRDGDGQSNRDEFSAGTDPLAATSLFRAWFTPTGSGTGEISYPSSGARLYRVEKYSEGHGAWETELPAVRGSGGTVIRPVATPQPRGIYRVRSELP